MTRSLGGCSAVLGKCPERRCSQRPHKLYLRRLARLCEELRARKEQLLEAMPWQVLLLDVNPALAEHCLLRSLLGQRTGLYGTFWMRRATRDPWQGSWILKSARQLACQLFSASRGGP
mmetsp:Transcript_22535/g.46749  ORF Transcript_22535/g.46749 Transcript_22535/m.46749 type:complete len:118 (-) Transcript_22535:655-1008(-)